MSKLQRVSLERQKALEGNLWRVCLIFLLFCSFAFAIPVCVLIWREAGLSMRDIFLLQVGFASIWALAEIPTGYLADRIGRRSSVLLGSLLGIAGALVYCRAHSFEAFLLGEVLLGCGFALASGADLALLYDTLLELGRESEFTKYSGRRQAVTLVGASVFTVLGGYLAEVDLRLTLYTALGGKLVLLPIAWGLIEPKVHSGEGRAAILQALRQVLKQCLWQDAFARWAIVFPAILFGQLQVVLWLYQPYFELLGLGKHTFGWLFALFNVTAALAARNAESIQRRLDLRSETLLLLLMMSLSFALMCELQVSMGYLFILLHQVVRGYMNVVYAAALNRRVSSQLRATALSVQNFVFRALYVALLAGLSGPVDALGTGGTLRFLALAGPAAGLLVWLGLGWRRTLMIDAAVPIEEQERLHLAA